MKKVTFIILFLIAGFSAFSQCKISGKKTTCVKDLVLFNLTPPSGTSIKSCKWDFGDGFITTDIFPSHIYKTKGIYTITCDSKLSNGNSCSSAYNIEAFGLPLANFGYASDLDTCQYTNKICIFDKSTPDNSGQPIAKRLVVWGNSDFNSSNNPNYNDNLCMKYVMPGTYKIVMEVTDNKGCKSTTYKKIKIIPGVESKIDTFWKNKGCLSAEFCFKNASKGSGYGINYLWTIPGQSPFYEPFPLDHCEKLTQSKTIKAKLLVTNNLGCKSIDTISIKITTGLKGSLLVADSVVCYNTTINPTLTMKNVNGYNIEWLINGKPSSYSDSTFIIDQVNKTLNPGLNTITCRVKSNSCLKDYTKTILINGPKAIPIAYPLKQCGVDEKVLFADLTELTDRKKANWSWQIFDTYGENCISNRTRGINKYKNCNSSIDWYTKHNYTEAKSYNPVLFKVKDLVTGCSDSIELNIITNACGSGRCIGGNKSNPDKICQGSIFLPGPVDENDPDSFSMDAGKSWIKFPSFIPKKYTGLQNVYLKFKIKPSFLVFEEGDDSIKIIKNDGRNFKYVFNYYLYINPLLNVDFILKQNTDCKKTSVILLLKEKKLDLRETLSIDWGDGQKYTVAGDTNKNIDSLKHTYFGQTGKYVVTVYKFSKMSCMDSAQKIVGFGNILTLNSNHPCFGQKTCFEFDVLDLFFNKHWSDSTALGKTKVDLGDNTILYDQYSYCHNYTTPGAKDIAFTTISSQGCKDTITESMYLLELKANVTDESKQNSCSGFKQFIDSSYCNDPSADLDYFWDFSDGKSTNLRFPFQNLDINRTYYITHSVSESKYGCSDTIKFPIRIKNPTPFFPIIMDSIVCANTWLKLKSQSKFCSQYLWELGDSANTTKSMNNEDTFSFYYGKPGLYNIKLTGIDTFYNQSTKNVYYCTALFPGEDETRSLRVLPVSKTTIGGPDTICVGQEALFSSKTDVENQWFNWDFGDGTLNYHVVVFSDTISHSFSKDGKYTVWSKPQFYIPADYPTCNDSASKEIYVVSAKADFDIDLNRLYPLVYFDNKSKPSSASPLWDFGQPSSFENSSTEWFPTHNYNSKGDSFKVCLEIKTNYCKDEICKTIQYIEYGKVKVGNVFTPEGDGINDEFDIMVVGEKSYELFIYDRWGVPVYHSNEDSEPGKNKNWNGRLNNTGPLCTEGTYYFTFKYNITEVKSKEKKISGVITLLR